MISLRCRVFFRWPQVPRFPRGTKSTQVVRGHICQRWVEDARKIRRSPRSYSTPDSMSATVPNAMEGVVATSLPTSDPQATPIAVDTPAEPPVVASETLYIQNLNEKIKVDGMICFLLILNSGFTRIYSAEGDTQRTVQILWSSARCCGSWKSANERTGFRII